MGPNVPVMNESTNKMICEMNPLMLGARSVEWLFGDVVNPFCFLDFKKNLKIAK